MVVLSALSLLVSMIGLYILAFASFSSNDDQQQDFITRAARKIRNRQEKKESNASQPKQPSPKFITLLETIIIGELVGLFFLMLTHDPTKYSILKLNAAALLIASFLCAGLTLLNVWLRKKTNIQFRIILQVICLVLGTVLMKISFRYEEVAVTRGYFDTPMYFYYGTVVVALATMLMNVIIGTKPEQTEFNFNSYLIKVIVVGLGIGTGLLVTSSIYF